MLQDFLPEHIKAQEVIIYGATVGGTVVYHILRGCGIQVKFFCDEYSEKKNFCGIPVIKIAQLSEYPNLPIILAVTRSLRSAYESLKKYQIQNSRLFTAKTLVEHCCLEENSFSEEDVIRGRAFIAQYPLYAEQLNSSAATVFPTIEVFITEKCTLRCKNCSHMIPEYTNPVHHDIAQIINSLDCLLKSTQIGELFILGGEPFLHPRLSDLLIWCTKNRGNLQAITIITNGTVVPSERIMELMRQAEVTVRISDYGKLSNKIDSLKKICKKFSVNYFLLREKWIDFGCGERHSYTKEGLQSIFTSCPFSHDYLLLDNRVYRCAHAAHLCHLQKVQEEPSDCLYIAGDLTNISEKISHFFSLQYLQACNYCNGMDYSKDVEPAIQKE